MQKNKQDKLDILLETLINSVKTRGNKWEITDHHATLYKDKKHDTVIMFLGYGACPHGNAKLTGYGKNKFELAIPYKKVKPLIEVLETLRKKCRDSKISKLIESIQTGDPDRK